MWIFHGWFDLIIQRIIDMMQALPLLAMALVMVEIFGAVIGKHHHSNLDTPRSPSRTRDPVKRPIVKRDAICRRLLFCRHEP